MAAKLKIAVAGLGRVGWTFHFRRAHESDRFDLAAAIDPLEERLAEAREISGCRTYKTYGAFWKKEKPDIVAIATPTKLHERMARQALREGCHVILEKPMTTTLKSTDRILEEAEKHNRQVFVYQPHRLTAETQTIREIIHSGILGPVYLLRRTSTRYTRRSDWQSLKKNGGGMLNNYGAHFLDQLMYLSDGTPVTRVHCNLWAIATRGDADDVVKAWLKTESGQLLDVEINQATAIPAPPWHICGKYGTAVQEGRAFKIQYYDPAEAPPLEVTEGAAPGRSYDNQDRLPWQEKEIPIDPEKQLDFYANLYDVLTQNAKPYIPSEDSRELMRILEQCRKSAKF
ncbi:MAG: Gfo/Idh/MocA family oxidoreductase [bacterium]|nr:Gfo/Idh/MocA family oxidoreductase [bacterium]